MERKSYPSDVGDDGWTLQRAHHPRWVLGSLLLGVITCWLVACASLNTTTTPYAGAPHYPPGDPASVQILRTEPTKSHDRLGEIVVDAATHSVTPGNEVEQKLRQHLHQNGLSVSDATVRRRLKAGGWVYKRLTQTLPHQAPSAEQKRSGWHKSLTPSKS